MTGQRFIREWGKGIRGKGRACAKAQRSDYSVARGKLSKGILNTVCARWWRTTAGHSWSREVNTHCVALTSTEMGALGPLRMSALIHTGLRTLPSFVSRRRRSSEGPTALRLLKSSLMPVGRGPRAWGNGPSCSGQKEPANTTS